VEEKKKGKRGRFAGEIYFASDIEPPLVIKSDRQ
jgi:hypothetical protein